MFDIRTLITFLAIFAVGSAINPDNICVLVADGIKIVDDTNCAGYYTCSKGKATPATCPTGQYFNKENRGCVPKSQATCVDLNDNPCQGISGEKFVAKPNSCSGYFYCKNGVGTEGSCPNGLNFNPEVQACQYKTEYGCSATGGGSNSIDDNPDLLCAYIPNGIYFGSASNCATWIKCTNNIMNSGTCPDKTVFNVQTQSCAYKETYNCQQLNGDSSETGGTPPSACNPGDPDFKPNPDSCSSYLKCSDKKYVVIKCPTGQYFDEDLKSCTNRRDAKNDCDRCEGTTLTFVNAYQDGCVGYLICSNGKQVGKGECDPGYYFNEEYASCVKGSHPGFGVCMLPCTQCNTYDAALKCGVECQCPDGGKCPCAQCETYDENLGCGDKCQCDECPQLPTCPPLQTCSQCDTYDEDLGCGDKCQCSDGRKCPCAQCETYDENLGCGDTCQCQECPPLPTCSQCDTYDEDLGCGDKCQCSDGRKCPCVQCESYDENLGCGDTCQCQECPPLPTCSQCDTYDKDLGCGDKCQCQECPPVPTCSQCDTYDEDLGCGDKCQCPVGQECPCAQCDTYDEDLECGVKCQCPVDRGCPCTQCEYYDAGLGCGSQCYCELCPS